MKSHSCDLCVVGSGAAGSVIAHRAARRGRSVVIVEQGPYVRAAQMNDAEIEMIPRLYKDGGLQMNTSMDMFILQGACVGGSTTLSNMVMMRAPGEVLDEWRRFGADVDEAALSHSYQVVDDELGTAEADASTFSGSTRRFVEGARALGLSPTRMRKALGSCRGCGNCNIGCSFDAKRSALSTYVPWAEAAGARVLADTEALRIELVGRRAIEVQARSTRTHEQTRIAARQVVVAAGAIGSSALLLRSGIRRNVGTRVSFNGGSMVIADFDEPLDAYDADQMTWCVQGDGYIIEPTHNPPMSAALTTPGWMGQHVAMMRRQRHLAYAGSLVGTEATGKVVHSHAWGHEETRFQASPSVLDKVRRGLKAAAEVFFAAGARRVILPTHRFRSITSSREIDEIDRHVVSTKRISFGSAHPQGGNPWSSDPRVGVVDADFAVHGTDNLFVCDASVFPSCVRVNPVATILALANCAAARIDARA
ncbi:MAG TPA: GMC family oxidoreductase [Polyangiaceae bacterium]|nr:GMC family oxidoreductase [Polyangiaceae bacterium]